MTAKTTQINLAHSGSLSINCDIAHQANAKRPGLLRSALLSCLAVGNCANATNALANENGNAGESRGHAVPMLLQLYSTLPVRRGIAYGTDRPPQADESAGAHIFQLSIAALTLTILVFPATADWKRPLRGARRLVFAAAALVLAFGALYYLEHYRDPQLCGPRVP
jgi:hypothetical protein